MPEDAVDEGIGKFNVCPVSHFLFLLWKQRSLVFPAL
jgi:hypothetical protein